MHSEAKLRWIISERAEWLADAVIDRCFAWSGTQNAQRASCTIGISMHRRIWANIRFCRRPSEAHGLRQQREAAGHVMRRAQTS